MSTISKAYNDWSSQYDTNENKTRDLEKIAARETLGLKTFGSVIEIGCGTGKNTEWLCLQSGKIDAMDFSSSMLAIAKSKIKNPNVAFHFTDLTQPWPASSGTADLVCCSLVLEHIENLDFVFNEAFDKLKAGGIFYLCELHPAKQYAGTKARFTVGGNLVELEIVVHHVSEFVNAALNAGFKIEEMREWFDGEGENEIPRLLSLVVRKD